MGTRRDREIERLLDKAQFEQSCLGATNRIMREALDRRIGEQLVRPRPRLYARKAYWEKLGKSERERHIIRGLAALHPDWVFCQASAALMLGLPVSLRRLKKAHVIMPGTHSKAGIALKCQSKVPRATAAAGIVQVTSLEDTIVDCLLAFDFKDGLAIADAALARLGNDGERLKRLVRERAQAPGTAPGARDHTLGRFPQRERRRVDRARRHDRTRIHAARAAGCCWRPLQKGESWRCDYFWVLADGTRVAGELDGPQKYTNPEMTKGQSAWKRS